MKNMGLSMALALGLGLTVALLLMAGARSSPAVAAPGEEDVEALSATMAELHVCPSGCAYSSVQEAVDTAGYGDVIKVATGTYTDIHARNGITQVVYISQTVTIQGGYTTDNWTTPDPVANPTTLDAQGQGRVLVIANNDVAIKGLRITGGDATGLGGGPNFCQDIGGGVYIQSGSMVTISDNWLYDNTAACGGGFARGSNAVLSGNRILANTAESLGGGLFLDPSYGTLSGNVIAHNTAGTSGGGLVFTGMPTLINNVITDNQASVTGSGIAMAGPDGCPVLLHNTIARNLGGDGTGIGVFDFVFGPADCTLQLTNTVLADQSVGIGIDTTGFITITIDGVLWHNVPITVSESAAVTVTAQNQYSGNPAFAADGYHLTAGSAAIDKGPDSGITVDIDGDPRPAGAGYDLGADEFWWRKVYLPLVLKG